MISRIKVVKKAKNENATTQLNMELKLCSYFNKILDGDYQITNEILVYLKHWLVSHIQESDKKFVNCFKENCIE